VESFFWAVDQTSTRRLQIQANQHSFCIRQVADDFFDWRREMSYQGRDRDDLVSFGKLGILQEVHDLNAVFSGKMLVTDFIQIGKGRNRLRSLTCYIQLQDPDLFTGTLFDLFLFFLRRLFHLKTFSRYRAFLLGLAKNPLSRRRDPYARRALYDIFENYKSDELGYNTNLLLGKLWYMGALFEG